MSFIDPEGRPGPVACAAAVAGRVTSDFVPSRPPPPRRPVAPGGRGRGGLWGWMFALMLLGAAVLGLSTRDPQARPRVVVLPFAAAASDALSAAAADALTDRLTEALAARPGLDVVALDRARPYAGRPLDAVRLHDELGVRYAVDGTLRGTSGGLHVDVRVVDTGGGASVLGESFEAQAVGPAVDRLGRSIGAALDGAAASAPR